MILVKYEMFLNECSLDYCQNVYFVFSLHNKHVKLLFIDIVNIFCLSLLHVFPFFVVMNHIIMCSHYLIITSLYD